MVKKTCVKMDEFMVKTKIAFSSFMKEEKGDFGVGQLAAIVAAIVILGSIIAAVTTNMDTWVGDIWTAITDMLK